MWWGFPRVTWSEFPRVMWSKFLFDCWSLTRLCRGLGEASDSHLTIAQFRGGSCGTCRGLDWVSRWRGLRPQQYPLFRFPLLLQGSYPLFGFLRSFLHSFKLLNKFFGMCQLFS